MVMIQDLSKRGKKRTTLYECDVITGIISQLVKKEARAIVGATAQRIGTVFPRLDETYITTKAPEYGLEKKFLFRQHRIHKDCRIAEREIREAIRCGMIYPEDQESLIIEMSKEEAELHLNSTKQAIRLPGTETFYKELTEEFTNLWNEDGGMIMYHLPNHWR